MSPPFSSVRLITKPEMKKMKLHKDYVCFKIEFSKKDLKKFGFSPSWDFNSIIGYNTNLQNDKTPFSVMFPSSQKA